MILLRLLENVADLRIGDEVHIPLAVADFDVGEALCFSGRDRNDLVSRVT